MSLSSRYLAAILLASAVGGVLGSVQPVAAHAIGGTFQLPVPLWLYLTAAAIAVGASFVITAIVSRNDSNRDGYLIAHYLTLVIQGVVWLPALIADPLMSLAPELDWLPIGLVWYLSVAAIVFGHVAGIVLAHRHARHDAPGRSVIAGLPMVALMIGYTVLSLWIIAQPTVIEPDARPEATAAREP